MKKIAIMGARGFVGKNLTEYLQKKYQVFPITRDDFSLLDSEKVKSFLEQNEIDIIIHCANEGGSRKSFDKADVIGNNLKMFFHLERCLNKEQKLITFGSGAQYNKQRDLDKVKEEQVGEVLPIDDYGYSKYVISKYIKDKHNIISPIIFGLFGQYEDYTFKFISNAIVKNLLKMPIEINQNVVFDYLFLDDFLDIMEQLILDDLKYNEFNITPTNSIDLIGLAELINECSEHKSEIIVKNPGLNYKYTGDNTRLLHNFPGYKFTDYKTAIHKLYDYYKSNINHLDVDSVKTDLLIKFCKTK